MNLSCRVLLLLAFSCAVADAEERSFDQRTQAPAGGHLIVNLDLGSVSIAGSSTHEVAVRAKVSGSESDLSRLTIHMERDASGVQVRERYERTAASFWSLLSGDLSPRVQFTIEVPQDYPVEIKTSGGSLEVVSLHAGVHGTTNGGSIGVRDIAGQVNVHTMGGSISAEHVQGQAELVTMGGGITARDVRGDLEAHTMGGSISLTSVDGQVSAHTAGGSVFAEELGDHDVNLETSGGSIELRMPVTVHASIDASTFGGSVHSSIPVNIESSGHSFLKGSINGAGHTIRLHTNGGGISIEPRG